jgi:phage-related minor tail protein
VKFASGGIVDSPTPFKFAAGGSVQSGLMGEAGPEGILPLERGPDGKLGVHASGGGGSTTITVIHNNTFGGGVSPSQLAQGLAQNREQTKAEISDQIRRGSRMYSR